MYLVRARRLWNVCQRHFYPLYFAKPPSRTLQNGFKLQKNEEPPAAENKELVVLGSFEDIQEKNKGTYLEMIQIFINRDNVYRRGHVEFVYAALKNMADFNVHKDLDVYKAIINVLPKGKYIARNLIQVEFMHYPKQQQCMIDLLEQMEDNGVMPDYEMEDMLSNVFGSRSYPLRKYWRMMYWMPKFKNLTPWPLPADLSDDTLDLARCAIERISSVDLQTVVSTYATKDIPDAIDDTWIVSAQSPTQKRLVREHAKDAPVYVEGAFRVWLKNKPVNYFTLRANAKPPVRVEDDADDVGSIQVPAFLMFNRARPPPSRRQLSLMPSVHEQEDGVVLAVCATGTSSKDSLLSWIRHLEGDGNEGLAGLSVVFTLRSETSRDVATVNTNSSSTESKMID